VAIRLLYFGWVREAIGVESEAVTLPAEAATVADIVAWLADRSAGHAAAFAEPDRLRVAVDQELAGLDAKVAGAREIALFPPVTGGKM
jgi:molybdopterin synthase sulfur carrier subunit